MERDDAERERDAERDREAAEWAQRVGTDTSDPNWWSMVRQIGIDRRRAAVAELLSRPLYVPPEIDRLPEGEMTDKQRRAIVLWNAGLSYREIADQMGYRSRNAAVKLVRRAQRRVHDYWGTWDPAEFDA